MTSVINAGIIGTGRVGRLHAAQLAHAMPHVRLRAVCDVIPQAAQECGAECGVSNVCTDHCLVMEAPDIDAIFICSRTDTHAALIEEAANAGKHIFCEKPIALELENIDRALAAVEKAGVRLQVGFNRRFDANYARVRRAVAEGEIGIPHIMHIFSRDPSPPPIDYIRVSGGLFLDMTIHDFDMARFLMDSEPDEIYAIGGVMVDPAIGEAGDIDTTIITIRFQNGALATIDNSRRAVYGYDQRVEILGSKGSVSTENDYPNAALVRGEHSVWRDLPLNFFMERYTDSYLKEKRAFIDCLIQGKQPPVTGQDGRMAVVMAYAAGRSLRENRPVKLDEFD